VKVRAQYPHPYYWAAFVLTGDPGTVVAANSVQPLSKSTSIFWIIGLVGVVLLMVAGIIVLRRKGNGRAS